jgi:hypothetical protein
MWIAAHGSNTVPLPDIPRSRAVARPTVVPDVTRDGGRTANQATSHHRCSPEIRDEPKNFSGRWDLSAGDQEQARALPRVRRESWLRSSLDRSVELSLEPAGDV